MRYGIESRWEQFDVTGIAHTGDRTGIYGERALNPDTGDGPLRRRFIRVPRVSPGILIFLNVRGTSNDG